MLWKQGQNQEAAQEFRAELNNFPEHGLAMLYLADSDIKMNQLNDARPLLEKVVKTNPANSMGHLDLGIVYTKAGQPEDALRELKTVIALKPDDVSAHWRLGLLYRAMGKTAEAKAEYDKSKSLNETADEDLIKVLSKMPLRDNASQSTVPAPANQ
jgi:predicted Zn-dependent protease